MEGRRSRRLRPLVRVDEAVKIREDALRVLSVRQRRRLATDLATLADVGERSSWTVPPPHELSVMTSRQPAVVGAHVEEAARRVRRAVRELA